MNEPVNFTNDNGVAVATMDDGKANALSMDMIKSVLSALDRAEAEAKAFVLAGRPGRFCAGFDLKTMMQGPGPAKELFQAGAEMFLRLYESPLPIVAACTGHALAGGALLLCVCDTRIGTRGAFKLGLNEVQINMTLPVLGVELARDRLSKRRFVEATLQARVFTPDESVDVGYLDRVEEEASVLTVAKEEATRLGALPRDHYAATKLRLRRDTTAKIRELGAADLDEILQRALGQA